MGNAASGREGKSRHSEGRPVPDRRGGPGRFSRGHSSESMGNSPPDSPGSAARSSPLMFTPQIPMVPIATVDGFSLGSYSNPPPGQQQQGMEGEGGMSQEQGVPTMIIWSHDGAEVSVEGSWDNWTTRQPLQKSGRDFMIVKMLPPGIYQYKFIVDGKWRYATDLPHKYDEIGNMNNELEVQEYVPENLDNLSGFEPPRSPPSSYNDPYTIAEDHAREPPPVPPHLHLTLLNVPPVTETPSTLPRPQHVILNHAYIERGKSSKSVIALGLTHRFRSKYVTVIMYKPMQSALSTNLRRLNVLEECVGDAETR